MHLQNNSFFSTSATADSHSDLFNMKSCRLTQGAFIWHAKKRSPLDRAKQLRRGRQLHYCLCVTDGWRRWQTRRINWQGSEKETSLRYGFPGVSRCIFSQMSCCAAVCGVWFCMLNVSCHRSLVFVEALRTWWECPMTFTESHLNGAEFVFCLLHATDVCLSLSAALLTSATPRRLIL